MSNRHLALLLTLFFAAQALAQAPEPTPQRFQELEAQSRAIKAEVLDLEAELSALEQDIRYPAQTRWTVFVTAEDSNEADLSQIQLQVAGRVVASHQYSDEEQKALRDGGAHRLYIGSMNAGEHPVSVRYVGKDGNETFNGDTAFVMAKPAGPQLLELHWQPEADESMRLGHKSFADTP